MSARLLSRAIAFVVAASIIIGIAVSLPRAGADESHGSSTSPSSSGYSTSVKTMPNPVKPGEPAKLDIEVHDGRHKLVTSYTSLHTRPMHLIAVSQDLEDFHHVHPALGTDGHLRTAITFEKGQPYSLFLEYEPKGGSQQLSRARVTPRGAHAATPHWNAADAFTGETARSSVVRGTRVVLASLAAKVVAGKATRLIAKIRDDSGGPADVKDYLGMPGHAILLSKDLSKFQHLHGERGGSGSHGGHGMTGAMPGMSHGASAPMPSWTTSDDLGFDVTFPEAGLYKLFVQLKRGANVITAPFIVGVAAPAAPARPHHHP